MQCSKKILSFSFVQLMNTRVQQKVPRKSNNKNQDCRSYTFFNRNQSKALIDGLSAKVSSSACQNIMRELTELTTTANNTSANLVTISSINSWTILWLSTKIIHSYFIKILHHMAAGRSVFCTIMCNVCCLFVVVADCGMQWRDALLAHCWVAVWLSCCWCYWWC